MSAKLCPQCGTRYEGDNRFCTLDGATLVLENPTDNLTGNLLADRYLVGRKLGEGGMGEVMKDPNSRFFVVEHFAGMLVAIILIHIGKAQAKKRIGDKAKHRRTLIFYLLALLIILASIPWPFRQVGAGSQWF